MSQRKRSTFGRIFRRKDEAGKYFPGFYVRVRSNGQEATRYAGPDRKIANEVLANLLWLSARQDLLGETSVTAKSFKEAETVILKHFKARHAASTYRADEGRLMVILEHFGSTPMDKITQGDVREFLDGLIVDGELSPKTVNRYTSCLSVTFTFAVQKGYARMNPVDGIKRHKEAEVAIPFVSDSDVNTLIAAAADDEFSVFVRLVADSGLRRSEAIRLAWGDIDLHRGTLLVRKSKNHAPREVPLTANLKAALDELRQARHLSDRRKADPVFPHYQVLTPGALTARFRALAKRAGFAGLRLHDMRHAFCSRLAQAGVPIPTIKVLAGHRSIATTMRYAGHVPGGATFEAIRRLDRPDEGSEGDAKGDTEN